MFNMLFRGRIDRGEWLFWDIFGRFVDKDDIGKRKPFLIERTPFYRVADFVSNSYNQLDLHSIGVHLGRRDKHNEMIFSGDVLNGSEYPCLSNTGVRNYFAEVRFDEDNMKCFMYFHQCKDSLAYGNSIGKCEDFDDEWDSDSWEILGHVQDEINMFSQEFISEYQTQINIVRNEELSNEY